MGMVLVESVTVGSGGASSIEFTSIPQDGVDLLLVISSRADNASLDRVTWLTFNSDTGSNYTLRALAGNGSTASSFSGTGANINFPGNGGSATSNTFSNAAVYVSNYTSSASKSLSVDVVTENNGTEALQRIYAGSYSTSSAITTVTILHPSNNFVQHSTASLYKITAD